MHAMASRYCARGQIAIFDRRLPPPSISLHTSSRHFIAIQHVQFTSMKCLNSNFFNISGKSDRGAIPRTALQSATAEAPTSPVREDSNDDESDLQNFLSWLVANGVQGIGQEGSKLALFQSENGERGLMCEEPVSKGDVVLEVPLRLALTDHSEDAESNQLLYPGAPWSVRLACKLLRHLAAGKRSPWAPYIKVLPRHVPAPLESFTWEDISALRYPSAQEALHSADWLRADAFMATSEEARGGLGEEAFRWALSVVHSRTFANAAPGGGVGVRMLVPLVDMLNHGGDEVVAGSLGLGGNKVVATDTVRWDLLPPARSSSGGWSMAVSATKDLQPGQEVLLSYGERPNDDFFLHYGFVPRANPHDDAVLWPDLESSLEWHYERIGAVKLPREEAQELYLAALEEGRREQVAEMRQMRQQQQKSGADSVGGEEEEQQAGDVPPEIARQLAQIKVLAGGQVTAAVMRAFTAVSGGDLAAAERAVAFRCAEVLWNMAPPSTSPFVVTGADEAPSGTTRPPVADGAADGDMRGGAAQHIESYRSGEDVADEEVVTNATTGGGGGGLLMELAMLLADDDPRLVTAAAAEEEAEKVEPDSDEARFWAEQLRGYHQVLLPRFVELLPEGAAVAAGLGAAPSASEPTSPAATVTSITDTTAAASTTGARGSPATIDRTPAGAGIGIKSRYGLPPPSKATVAAAQDATIAISGGARGNARGNAVPLRELVRALLLGPGTEDAAKRELRLTGPQRLSMAFRCYKQMVLWDVLLGSPVVEPKDLVDFLRRGGGGGK